MILAALLTAAYAAPLEHVRVTVFDEAIAVPATAVVPTPFHPGLLIGASLWSMQGDHLAHRVQLDIGGYLHRPVEHALFVLPSWQGTWRPHPVLGFSALAGLGYKHSFYAAPAWAVVDGEWARRRPAGHPEVTAQLGLGIDLLVDERVSILVQHRGSVDGPYSELAPALLHLTTHVGVEVHR